MSCSDATTAISTHADVEGATTDIEAGYRTQSARQIVVSTDAALRELVKDMASFIGQWMGSHPLCNHCEVYSESDWDKQAHKSSCDVGKILERANKVGGA